MRLDVLQFHPLADLFPLMEGADLDALVEDIRVNGQLEPITLYEGMILDGRNRFRACQTIGQPLVTKDFTGYEPLRFVWSMNAPRRHLNEAQRAMVGQKYETMNRERPKKDAAPHLKRAEIAKAASVPVRCIASAKVVRSSAAPEIVARVERGELGIDLAAKLAALPRHRQVALATEPESVLRSAVKAEQRAGREQELAAATAAASKALGTKVYAVIYADLPWRFEPYSRKTGLDRAADCRYPTVSTEDIASPTVPAAGNCALFLWATAPMLPDARLSSECC